MTAGKQIPVIPFEDLVGGAIGPEVVASLKRLRGKGRGFVVFENQALDSANCGHRIFLTYGQPEAQYPTKDVIPKHAPDGAWGPGWRYLPVAIVEPPSDPNQEKGESP